LLLDDDVCEEKYEEKCDVGGDWEKEIVGRGE